MARDPRGPNDGTIEGYLREEIRKLEERIKRLEESNVQTTHQTSTDDILDPLEGEYVIDYRGDRFAWYSGGAWHTISADDCGQIIFAFMDTAFQINGQLIDTRTIRTAIDRRGGCYVLMSRTQQLSLSEGFFINVANLDTISHSIAAWDGWVTRIATNQREQIRSSTPTVIAAGGTTTLSWSHGSGAAILDFTSPTFPKVPAAGVYAFDLNLVWT